MLDNRLAIFYKNKSLFGPQRSTKARTKNCEKKWAEIEAKGSEEGWSRRRVEAEKKKLETVIHHFLFPKLHMLSHVSNSICRMGSPDNFSTDVSELLHRQNVMKRTTLPIEYSTRSKCSGTIINIPGSRTWHGLDLRAPCFKQNV